MTKTEPTTLERKNAQPGTREARLSVVQISEISNNEYEKKKIKPYSCSSNQDVINRDIYTGTMILIAHINLQQKQTKTPF